MGKESSQTMLSSGQNSTLKDLGLNERLGLISLIDEGMRMKSYESHIVAHLFSSFSHQSSIYSFSLSLAWAAASLAMGTLGGEQET